MKTRSYSKLELEELESGMCILSAYTPGEGRVSVELSPDELEIFLVAILNSIERGREAISTATVKKNLEKERRKNSE